MEPCLGGEETNELPSPAGRGNARRDGLAPGCKLEFRSGEPTWPKAETLGSDPDSVPSLFERCFPQRDWNLDGDEVAPDGEPTLTSDMVGEAPSLENEARCESERPSLSPWSREKRRIFSCSVSKSLSELGIRSSSNVPISSESSQSSWTGGRAPTLADIMPLLGFI